MYWNYNNETAKKPRGLIFTHWAIKIKWDPADFSIKGLVVKIGPEVTGLLNIRWSDVTHWSSDGRETCSDLHIYF